MIIDQLVNSKNNDPESLTKPETMQKYQNVINEATNLKDIIVTPPKYVDNLTAMCDKITNGSFDEVKAIITPMKVKVMKRAIEKD